MVVGYISIKQFEEVGNDIKDLNETVKTATENIEGLNISKQDTVYLNTVDFH